MNIRARFLAITTLLLILALSSFASVNAATPTYVVPVDTASVDGDYGEWDTTGAFLEMYRSGNPAKVVEAKVWLVYDPSISTLYFLVLSQDGPVQTSKDDEHRAVIDNIKVFDAAVGDDGTAPDFCYIQDGDGETIGWEASCIMTKGEHELEIVHTNVYTDAEWNTAATITTTLFVVPEYALGGLIAVGACFAAFVAFKKRQANFKPKI